MWVELFHLIYYIYDSIPIPVSFDLLHVSWIVKFNLLHICHYSNSRTAVNEDPYILTHRADEYYLWGVKCGRRTIGNCDFHTPCVVLASCSGRRAESGPGPFRMFGHLRKEKEIMEAVLTNGIIRGRCSNRRAIRRSIKRLDVTKTKGIDTVEM